MNIEKAIAIGEMAGGIDTIRKLSNEIVEMMYKAGYNDGIEEAAQSVIKASVFPKKDYGGPKADADRIAMMGIIEAEIRKLRK